MAIGRRRRKQAPTVEVDVEGYLFTSEVRLHSGQIALKRRKWHQVHAQHCDGVIATPQPNDHTAARSLMHRSRRSGDGRGDLRHGRQDAGAESEAFGFPGGKGHGHPGIRDRKGVGRKIDTVPTLALSGDGVTNDGLGTTDCVDPDFVEHWVSSCPSTGSLRARAATTAHVVRTPPLSWMVWPVTQLASCEASQT